MQAPMWSFVVIGQNAIASGGFSLDDLPSSSGRLDVLVRCIRAALLFSHGVRHDVRIYLLLCGGSSAPRALRVDGASARFVRPDERSLALLVKKALARAAALEGPSFVETSPGVAVANAGLAAILADIGDAPRYLLDEDAADLRTRAPLRAGAAFILGDHLGVDELMRTTLAAAGFEPISVGPVSLHSEDAITIVLNELDRTH
jgi:tRNA (pseudouridine54-N1)-methyltransferase